MTKLVELQSKYDRQVRIVARFSVAGTAAATAANYPEHIFTAPFPCRVVSVTAKFTAASSSGTLTINKAASGTATSSGTAILTTPLSLAGAANTNVVGTLSATASVLKPGDTIGCVLGGTLTNQTGVGVTIVIAPL